MSFTPEDRAKGRSTKRQKRHELFNLWLEHYLSTSGKSATASLRAIGYSANRIRVTAGTFLKKAREEGLIDARFAAVKGAMGVDEIIQRLSDQARGEDYASKALIEIAEKSNMDEFYAERVEPLPPQKEPAKEGDPAPTPDVYLARDLVAAKRKGLLKFVHAFRATPNGDTLELESRPDALKAVASIQKGALDTLVKIHGLGEVKPPDPGHKDVRIMVLQIIRGDPETRRMADDLARRAASKVIEATATDA